MISSYHHSTQRYSCVTLRDNFKTMINEIIVVESWHTILHVRDFSNFFFSYAKKDKFIIDCI